jgi:Xaa-Pro dipeptidase
MTTPWKRQVPEDEIRQRHRRLRRAMHAAGMAAVLVMQRVDLYYLTGTAQSAYLLLPAEGEPLLCVRRYLPRARAESPLEQVVAVNSVKDLPGRIRDHWGGLPEPLGLELDVLPVSDYRFFKRLMAGCRLVDASPLILEARSVKSDWELAQMEAAAVMTEQTFAHMRRIVAPGMSEMDFAGRAEAFARRMGHGGLIRTRHYQAEGYPWHVLSGVSGGMAGVLDAPASGCGTSAAFPCGAGSKPMAPGEPIMVDFASVRAGYHLDETRMFAIGDMPDEAVSASQAVIDIHDEVIRQMRPGVAVGGLFNLAVSLADRMGYAGPFLGPPGAKVRFIGHGIGLEIVEPPFIAAGRRERLAAGMVLALEPKMVFEGRFGVGVESVVTVTDDGARLVSRVPVDIFIC